MIGNIVGGLQIGLGIGLFAILIVVLLRALGLVLRRPPRPEDDRVPPQNVRTFDDRPIARSSTPAPHTLD